jgi:hypothetical protein
MTHQEFTSNELLQKGLNDFLLSPAGMYALEIVLKQMEPREPNPLRGDLIHQAAISGMRAQGAGEVVTKLRALTIPYKKGEVVKDNEYEDTAVQILVKQGYTEAEAKNAAKEFHQTQPTK